MMSQNFTLFSMFLLGLSGCGHCIGMCGPLIFAFPGKTGKISGHLYYHVGRITAYVLTGVLISFTSGLIFKVISNQDTPDLKMVFKVQIAISLLSSLLLLSLGLIRLGILREPALISSNLSGGLFFFIQKFTRGKSRGKPYEMLYMGFLMGFLPCGLTYAAFSRVLPVSNSLSSALLMLFFGLGTLPFLLIIGQGASSLIRKYRKETELFSGVLMVGMALSLLVKAFDSLTP